jgi:hypothetical protein
MNYGRRRKADVRPRQTYSSEKPKDAPEDVPLSRGTLRRRHYRDGTRDHRTGDFPLSVTDAQHLDAHGRQARVLKAKVFGNRFGHVERATGDEWAAIVQANDC